jgi:multidrug efflux system outer membrane protein
MKYGALLLLGPIAAVAGLPSVGSDYQRPDLSFPANYRDVPQSDLKWSQTSPITERDQGRWWKAFDDPKLNGLVERALTSNQDLLASAARVAQARAVARIAHSGCLPSVDGSTEFEKDQNSKTLDGLLGDRETSIYGAVLGASWELDIFGRIRRMSEAARADAQASLAAYQGVRLTLAADVAATYFSLSALAREMGIFEDSIELRRNALEILSSRWRNGAGSQLDVSRAESELASAEAEAAALKNQQAGLQNALAILVGSNPQDFEFEVKPLTLDAGPPSVPPGLPSSLLERRPDIIAAEAEVAAANARIGVAKAAFFPAISLTGSAGYASGDVHKLFETESSIWSVGPTLYLPIFQGGKNRANLSRNRSAFVENVATFRECILKALRDVQDALTAQRLLAVQSSAQIRAVKSAREGLQLVQARYEAGATNYFEVIDAQRTVLATERALTQVAAQRFVSSVNLFRAIGGGWNELPLAPN